MIVIKKETTYRIVVNGIAETDSTGKNWRYFTEEEKVQFVKERSQSPDTIRLTIIETTTTTLVKG